MPNYSDHFACLYDENEPVGTLGRGTHYSVLQATEWRTVMGLPATKGMIHRFAVIWDEDHDTRVIDVAEQMYVEGLLAPVQFIGERKGTLSILVASCFRLSCSDEEWRQYVRRVEALLSDVNGDSWSLNAGYFDKRVDKGVLSGIELGCLVNDDDERVAIYIRNVDSLWNLGTWPFKKKVTPEQDFGAPPTPPIVWPTPTATVPPPPTTRLNFGK